MTENNVHNNINVVKRYTWYVWQIVRNVYKRIQISHWGKIYTDLEQIGNVRVRRIGGDQETDQSLGSIPRPPTRSQPPPKISNTIHVTIVQIKSIYYMTELNAPFRLESTVQSKWMLHYACSSSSQMNTYTYMRQDKVYTVPNSGTWPYAPTGGYKHVQCIDGATKWTLSIIEWRA